MAKKVDWYYRRSGCVTCKRMDEFLEAQGIEAKEVRSANKEKLGRDDALELANSVNKVIAARGQKVVELKMKGVDQAELEKHIIGPTGNLRSPTIRKGKTLYVGFNESFADTM